jgi:uncharacterized protein (DUF1778 family)
VNVNQFVLSASLREAEDVMSGEAKIMVSPEQFEAIVILMDEAVPPNARPATYRSAPPKTDMGCLSLSDQPQ